MIQILLRAAACTAGLLFPAMIQAQVNMDVIRNIQQEAHRHSQLELLGQELVDDIGPRLIGSPAYRASQDWVIRTYNGWGIEAWNENYGQWQSWERGKTVVEMTYPRYSQLRGIQLAWSPATPKGKPVSAEVITLPAGLDSLGFRRWLPSVKGRIVLISRPELSGRPAETWEKNALGAHYSQFTTRRDSLQQTWNTYMKNIGYTAATLPKAVEAAGAVAVLSSYWSGGWGASRIFAARTERIPNIDIALEDYNMLYRMAERGQKPKVSVQATSGSQGLQPVANTIGLIKGREKPEEYIMLSAHLDSWDGGTGATDNGTGTILMMEVMRILKKHYPNPRRSVIVGHWGGEEQGLNGSRAYIEDHPEMRDKISVLFNQDNGTGRISRISGNGFLDAYDYFGRWLQYVPDLNKKELSLTFPGEPGKGGSDYASFLPYDIPAFFLLGNSWDYGTYTWHTQLDTYDKIVFEDMRMNAETIAILVYLACEEPEMFSRRKAELPVDLKSGKRTEWPKAQDANRHGRY
ncbi:MAG: peptidase M28 [Bacteroidetes bacterium 47-18]|nr:MAG: peptidase M28 [Bacteroidetes bacterium 47-18]